MKHLFALLLCLAVPSLAANSFPPCNASSINRVWRAQDTTYWWCSGSTWFAVTATPDGGADLSSLNVSGNAFIDGGLTVVGPTVLGDAGVNSVTAAGTITVTGAVNATGAVTSATTMQAGNTITNTVPAGNDALQTVNGAFLRLSNSGTPARLSGDSSGNIIASNGVSFPGGNVADAVHRGTITLSGGTGTHTVLSGAVCTCTDTTANASVRCAVSSTTLTATGTGTDVIAYTCL